MKLLLPGRLPISTTQGKCLIFRRCEQQIVFSINRGKPQKVCTVETQGVAVTAITPVVTFREESAYLDQNANQSMLVMIVDTSCSQSIRLLEAAVPRVNIYS